MMTASYSPDDNKLRLYASERLNAETYKRVRGAGFIWAPKQDLFVAPMWTPDREDLLLELCGEIGDEDTSLIDRAEDRADRFQDYSENRAKDADRAHKAVAAIANNIPLGQPILVGHHSERYARNDAERIENGMRRAVKMWEQSKYWKSRAAGAIRHAKYKELPSFRARRIKGLEADQRKQERNKADAEKHLKWWNKAETLEHVKLLERVDWACFEFRKQIEAGEYLPVIEHCRKQYAANMEWAERWIVHISNRLEYERATLGEAGGIVTDKTGPEKGGACKCWASPRGGWSYIVKVNKVSVTVYDNWGNGGENFTRTISFDKLKAVMTAAEVQEARKAKRLIEAEDKTGFFLKGEAATHSTSYKPPEPTKFDAMKDQLKAGVQVVTANQLFPTPPDLAARMVEEAEIKPGHDVLEPSAGTGNILRACFHLNGAGFTGKPKAGDLVAVEINPALTQALANEFPTAKVVNGDFLNFNGDLGTFDRILMNPPFENGSDIKHIKHALAMLKPGGRLVAICANGPRQQKELQPIATTWETLPEETFKEAGTGVQTVILTIDKPA